LVTAAALTVIRPALMLALILARLASGSWLARYASSRTLPYTAAAAAAAAAAWKASQQACKETTMQC
jgi:hypothetical protein